MKIGELYEGGYMVSWNDTEHFKPKDMAEVIGHLRDAKYYADSSDKDDAYKSDRNYLWS